MKSALTEEVKAAAAMTYAGPPRYSASASGGWVEINALYLKALWWSTGPPKAKAMRVTRDLDIFLATGLNKIVPPT